ncbi:unnamed protein product [Gongylonema pulchrum]|uniref:Tho2 domain-containing protein n=1 Tax=Gongylonema pulchrum TaxID=637853 RepID=A0A183D240_9BILA|nr:unnamed protein product [Gongylonema pulchrum]
MSLVLEYVQRWHSEKGVFEKECLRFPGFMTKLQVRNADATSTDSASDGMNYESYRTLCHKWQYRMTRSCLSILDGTNYVMMRNCLIVMIKTLANFPLIENHIANIEKAVNRVRDVEKGHRDDLSLMAASYAGHLRMRKTHTYTESQFHNRITDAAKKATRATPTKSPAGGNSATVKTPSAKNINAEAVDSSKQQQVHPIAVTVPDPRKASNGVTESRRAVVADEEKRKAEMAVADAPSKKKLSK